MCYQHGAEVAVVGRVPDPQGAVEGGGGELVRGVGREGNRHERGAVGLAHLNKKGAMVVVVGEEGKEGQGSKGKGLGEK